MRIQKIPVIAFSLSAALIVSMLLQCCNKSSEEECKDVNPNGDSELALLMRNMATHLETEKSNLTNGVLPSSYPAGFEKIATATPTVAKDLSEHYNGFATGYVESLKMYYEKKSLPDAKAAYNNLVNSCINCHNNECPGPIKRIEKLFIKE